ncbi:MAG: Do family serine endopeptidase [Myxococcaceae bacterium]|nr:Do family serine endopeptidase [Myxococcaceae bacterium]
MSPALQLAVLAAATVAAPALAQQPARSQNPQQPATREVAALPSFADLVESVKSAVVNVDVQTRVKGGGPIGAERFGDDLFEHFFGGPHGLRPEERFREGLGSGFIIDSKGVILTNDHVVEDAVNIEVTLDDGRTFNAEVVGRDPLTDVAVIKVKEKVDNLPAVKLGDSDKLRVGDWVVAIGNPFGLASSVSAGIVSATSRNINIGRYDEFIQTDAAINPGNSGGPLFNLQGEVIGMNSLVASGAGIGFAVPSSLIRAILPQLERTGKVVRGYLGVQIQDLTPNLAKALGVPSSHGAIVTDVTAGTPAAQALRRDDVIVALNGNPVESSHELSRRVAMQRPGSKVTLTVFRGGKKIDVQTSLATRPDLEGVYEKEKEEKPADTKAQRQARVGLELQDMDARYAQGTGLPPRGALIREVRPGSAAERADLRPGMVVIEAGGKPVRTAQDLETIIRDAKAGSLLLLRVMVVNDDGSVSRLLRALQVP